MRRLRRLNGETPRAVLNLAGGVTAPAGAQTGAVKWVHGLCGPGGRAHLAPTHGNRGRERKGAGSIRLVDTGRSASGSCGRRGDALIAVGGVTAPPTAPTQPANGRAPSPSGIARRVIGLFRPVREQRTVDKRVVVEGDKDRRAQLERRPDEPLVGRTTMRGEVQQGSGFATRTGSHAKPP